MKKYNFKFLDQQRATFTLVRPVRIRSSRDQKSCLQIRPCEIGTKVVVWVICCKRFISTYKNHPSASISCLKKIHIFINFFFHSFNFIKTA